MPMRVAMKILSVSTFLVAAMLILPAAAQDTHGLGTIVAPLEPEREVGLPDQAPPAPAAVPVQPEAAPAAKDTERPAQARAGARQETAAAESAFGQWKMECMKAPAQAVPCQIVHRALSADQHQVVMVISLAYVKAAKATKFQMALPLGFSVQDGITIDVDGNHEADVRVSRCTAQGCLVQGEAAPSTIEAMEKGKIGAVSIKTVEGGTIRLPFSLTGFSEAYVTMKARNEANPS